MPSGNAYEHGFWYGPCMPASKVGARVLFKVAAADAIAAKHGLKLDHEKATFFGVTQSNYSRVVTGATLVGDKFITAVLE